MQAALSSTNPAPVPEIPGLFLSDTTIPSSPEHLQHYNITHVLSITSASSAPRIPSSLNISHKIVELDDHPYADLLSELGSACDFIHTALNAPRSPYEPYIVVSHQILVHCTQGISRSASIVIGYIMRTLNLEYADALAIIQTARPIVMPNQGFAEQLVLWRRMNYAVTDENGTEKAGYIRWKKSVSGLGEQERMAGMKIGMGRLAAAIGRRRMVERGVDTGDLLEDEKEKTNRGLVRQAEREIGDGITRVKDVLEKRRVEKEKQKLAGEKKEKKSRWEWEWGGE